MFNISHKGKIKMEDMREKKGKSIKSVIASLTRLNPEELKREQRIKREKYVPYNAKRFGQTFLKFDAWCESTRGRIAKKAKQKN